jgi:UDP-GlcNAc:undecaprenyl-phosphate GlcNAc-1-phosphate transferase
MAELLQQLRIDRFPQVWREYQAYGWLAFAVTVFATPLAIWTAQRLGVMDIPDRKLKPHARPTPYLGGTAICLGWSVALIAAMASDVVDWKLLLPILVGGVAISGIGLADDVRDVSPKIRLALGALVIAVVLVVTRTGFNLAVSVAGPLGLELPAPLAHGLSIAAGVFIVLGAVHSTNLIDGLDGLATGVTGVISAGFFLLASFLAVWEYSQVGDPLRLVLAIAMLGAALGFLPFNFNPARIFMGDAGSTLLGYNCGMLILLFAERGIFRWVVGALMIFALPVFDTALAMVRRWRSGKRIFEGDRSHFYDQLVQRGLSVRQTVAVCYALALTFVVVGLAVIYLRTRYAVLVYVFVWAVIALLAWRAGLTRQQREELNR